MLDDGTIRTWYRLYEEDGIEGLTNFGYEGRDCQLSSEQQEGLKAWVATALPCTTRQVSALAGPSGGASAETTVGAGVGANVLVGGLNRTATLQPVSVQGQMGLNLAVGVAGLDLPPAR